MPQIVWENNTNATLAAPITNSQTTIALTSGQGAQFPSPGVNQFFPVTIQSASLSTVFEICYCTSRSGDVLTVVRGQEGTPGTAFNAGDTVQNRATAGTQWPGALLYLGVTGTTTLTTVESGTFIECTASAPSAVTIPAPTAGVTYRFWNAQTAATITLSTPSGQFFGPFGSSAATYSLLPGVYIQLESDGSGWLVTVLQPSLSPLVNVISNTTLTFSQTGSTVEINGASGYTLTFPSPVGINGCFYWVVNLTTVAQTLSTPAAVFAGPNGSAAATLTMLPQSSFRINSDGVNWVVSQLSATILPKTIFSSASPGTAVIPLGWTHYRARAWTAGGGGGHSLLILPEGANNNVWGGGGGGSGLYFEGRFLCVPGETLTITPGTGGAGGVGTGSTGGAGGTLTISSSSSSSALSAGGGSGGTSATSTPAAGVGGAAASYTSVSTTGLLDAVPTILTGSGGMNGNVEAGGVNNSGSIETDLFLSGVGGTAPLGASPASMWNGASGSGQYPIGAGGNAGVQPNGNGNAGGPGYVIIDNG